MAINECIETFYHNLLIDWKEILSKKIKTKYYYCFLCVQKYFHTLIKIDLIVEYFLIKHNFIIPNIL